MTRIVSVLGRSVVAILAVLVLAFVLAVIATHPPQAPADLPASLQSIPRTTSAPKQEASALVAPVQVSHAGITVTLEMLTAGSDQTQAFVMVRGISPNEVEQQWDPSLLAARLEVGGQMLQGRPPEVVWTADTGKLSFSFPPMPADAAAGAVVITLRQSDSNWRLPFSLHVAAGGEADRNLLAPYSPSGASDTHQGITMTVPEVTHMASGTQLKYRVQAADPCWRFEGPGRQAEPELRDEQGQVYGFERGGAAAAGFVQTELVKARCLQGQPIDAEAASSPNVTDGRLAFRPTSSLVNRFTLLIPDLVFSDSVDAELDLDLGERPELNRLWALDNRWELDGLQLRARSASLRQEGPNILRGTRATYVLDLQLDAPADASGSRITSVFIESANPANSTALTGRDPSTGRIKAQLRFDALPKGRVHLRIRDIEFLVHGGWTIAWEVPITNR